MKSSPGRTSLLHPSSNYRSFPGPARRLFARRYIDLSILFLSPAAAGKKRPDESEKETDSADEVQQERDVRRTKHKKKNKKTPTRKKDVREEETHSDDS